MKILHEVFKVLIFFIRSYSLSLTSDLPGMLPWVFKEPGCSHDLATNLLCDFVQATLPLWALVSPSVKASELD